VKRYYTNVNVDKEPGEKAKDGAGACSRWSNRNRAESKTFETIGNTIREMSPRLGKIEPGGSSMVDSVANFLNKNAYSIAGKFETLGKIGTGLTVANFITSTYKDVKDGYGVGQAILKNGLTTGGS